MRDHTWLGFGLCALALLLLAVAGVMEANAADYTADDTYQAIHDVAADTGISEARIKQVVGCETGWTFDPYSRGAQGELGPVQLHPRGELMRFLREGWGDPFDPYAAIAYMGQRWLEGGASAWSCRA